MGRALLHVVFEEPLESLIPPIEVRGRIVNATMVDALRHALEALLLSTVYKVLTYTEVTESDGLYWHVSELSLHASNPLPLIRSEWHILDRLIIGGYGMGQLVRFSTWFAYLLPIEFYCAIRESRRLTAIK